MKVLGQCINSEKAPKAIGPYSPALKLGDFVYLSGQLSVNPDPKEATRESLTNLQNILAEMGMEMRHIVKTTVFLKNMDDFAAMNEVYATFFSEPYPARSAIQVARLPKDGTVEIEAFAIDTTAYEHQCCHGGECCGGEGECECDGECDGDCECEKGEGCGCQNK